MTNYVYIGTSLDGCIASADGDFGWMEDVPNPDGDDLGFSEFMERVDAVVTIGTGMAIAPEQIPLLVPGLGEILLGRMDVLGDTFSERHRARS